MIVKGFDDPFGESIVGSEYLFGISHQIGRNSIHIAGHLNGVILLLADCAQRADLPLSTLTVVNGHRDMSSDGHRTYFLFKRSSRYTPISITFLRRCPLPMDSCENAIVKKVSSLITSLFIGLCNSSLFSV